MAPYYYLGSGLDGDKGKLQYNNATDREDMVGLGRAAIREYSQ